MFGLRQSILNVEFIKIFGDIITQFNSGSLKSTKIRYKIDYLFLAVTPRGRQDFHVHLRMTNPHIMVHFQGGSLEFWIEDIPDHCAFFATRGKIRRMPNNWDFEIIMDNDVSVALGFKIP